MFKKVVSQIGFSPASVEQLAKFARSVRRRQHLHGWAVFVIAGLIIILGATTLLPHNHVTTPTANDLIPGGVLSADDATEAYDLSTGSFRGAADLFGISRDNITQSTQLNCEPLTESLLFKTGVLPYNPPDQASEREYSISDGSPLYIREDKKSPQEDGLCGTTESGLEFMISTIDGNIATSKLPDEQPIDRQLTLSHEVDTRLLKSDQVATWSLTVSNKTDRVVTESVWMPVGDLSEYANIISISDDGLISNDQSHILWPEISLNPDESYRLNVVAQAPQAFDETAQQSHNLNAYNCSITTVFGTASNVPVDCSLIKKAESTLRRLPSISVATNIVIFTILFIANLVTYLSLRTKSNELRLIRRQINTGSF